MTGALVGKLAMDGAREEMPAYDKLAAQYAGVLNDALYTMPMKRHRFWTPAALARFSASQYRCPRIDLGRTEQCLYGIWKPGSVYNPASDAVFSLSMSEDGRFAYTGALDGNLYEWDAKTGNPAHDSFVIRRIRHSPHGRQSRDGRCPDGWRVDLWNIETDEIISLDFPEGRRLHRAALHPDGKVIVTSLKSRDTEQYIPFGEVQAWSLQTGELLKTYDLGPVRRPNSTSPSMQRTGRFSF